MLSTVTVDEDILVGKVDGKDVSFPFSIVFLPGKHTIIAEVRVRRYEFGRTRTYSTGSHDFTFTTRGGYDYHLHYRNQMTGSGLPAKLWVFESEFQTR